MNDLFIVAISPNAWAVMLAGAVAVLVIAWFALRYWITLTHDPRRNEISTPTIDQMNAAALEGMNDPEEIARRAENEPAPADLLAAVSKKERDRTRPDKSA
jgi:hypothetical protein